MSHSSRSSFSESASWRLALRGNDDDDYDSCVDTSTNNQLCALRIRHVSRDQFDVQVVDHNGEVDGVRTRTIVTSRNPKSSPSRL